MHSTLRIRGTLGATFHWFWLTFRRVNLPQRDKWQACGRYPATSHMLKSPWQGGISGPNAALYSPTQSMTEHDPAISSGPRAVTHSGRVLDDNKMLESFIKKVFKIVALPENHLSASIL